MSHLLCTRNPMSEARRQHVHGPLTDATAFDWAIIIYMLAATSGVVGFIYWSAT